MSWPPIWSRSSAYTISSLMALLHHTTYLLWVKGPHSSPRPPLKPWCQSQRCAGHNRWVLGHGPMSNVEIFTCADLWFGSHELGLLRCPRECSSVGKIMLVLLLYHVIVYYQCPRCCVNALSMESSTGTALAEATWETATTGLGSPSRWYVSALEQSKYCTHTMEGAWREKIGIYRRVPKIL